jgi:hypothetical protein
MTLSRPTVTQPRSRFVRQVIAVSFWLLLWVPAGVLSTFIKSTVDPEGIFPGNYLVSDSVTGIPYLLPTAVLFFVLPMVAYRRRDALFFFVPFWNIAFTHTICWRLAGLPHVDWPERESSSDGNALRSPLVG